MNKFGTIFDTNFLPKRNHANVAHSILGNDVKQFPATDLFERFFSVVETNEDEIKAECNLCASRYDRKPGMASIIGDSITKIMFREHVKVFSRKDYPDSGKHTEY